ncbi:MAG: hypothetical protein ACP5JF_06225 [Candidatus Methanodesulfokora sp.]|jgi:hypothetical protein
MMEKLGACSFCMKWSIKGIIMSILALIASIYLRIFPLILITASFLAFFSALTFLHLIFYVKRREKCIRRVSGESRRNIKDFKLLGVIAFQTAGKVEDLSRLQDEDDIFLVDIGSIDIADQYKGKEVIIRVSDLYYYLEKLGKIYRME